MRSLSECLVVPICEPEEPFLVTEVGLDVAERCAGSWKGPVHAE